ncbi:TetR/AcrR family transcriptional regulator [Kitasatospora sp. MAP5-34]|uniref:TetR/AcrR family transcriptional regulator n=1 Tax=Kitasatospora sp. MAP5-34 TaxID=3035102 RepID=UPI0024769CB5|nr:TetR/AcrR family transcriptional regulator [Kitasatospora sp. MAP5-34]MDH6575243.1 TetR/AcrR family transcriptional repressor of nem operon [Kitasatospora sp. MAP5-34]
MATQDRLIETMQELLRERGYTGTSPKAVQQRAGVGQGSMYHHFTGKPDLAAAALRRSAEQLRTRAEQRMAGPGTAYERIEGYLLAERESLRGCPVGRMAQDAEVIADPELRAPVHETFEWLCGRLAEIVAEGRAAGEFPADTDPADLAAAVAAVVQGGYVLARAADSPEPFQRAVHGVLAMLRACSATKG